MRWAGALLVAGLVACSGVRPPPPPQANEVGDSDERDVVDHWREEREAMFARREVDECGEARRMMRTLCMASERICRIAGRHVGEAELAEACAGGQAGCEEALRQCARCR